MNRYWMTFKILARLKSMKKIVVCRWCERSIIIGDEVVNLQGGSSYRIYHAGCFDALHYDVPNGDEIEVQEVAMIAI